LFFSRIRILEFFDSEIHPVEVISACHSVHLKRQALEVLDEVEQIAEDMDEVSGLTSARKTDPTNPASGTCTKKLR